MGLPRVEKQAHFYKELLGLSCHPGDRTLVQVTVPSPGWLVFFSP